MNKDHQTLVNKDVDKLLRLVEIPTLPDKSQNRRRIRALQIGQRCPVLDKFAQLRRSDGHEFKKLIAKIEKIAAEKEELKLSTVKRLGNSGVIQVSGDNCRVFCFLDRECVALVCIDLFHIGRGNKKTKQNEAIEEAKALFNRWANANRIPGSSDVRLE